MFIMLLSTLLSLTLTFLSAAEAASSYQSSRNFGSTPLLRARDLPVGTCDATTPCVNSACCGSNRLCGYSPLECGSGCTSNCDAKADCGQFGVPGSQNCPLGVCCSTFGQVISYHFAPGRYWCPFVQLLWRNIWFLWHRMPGGFWRLWWCTETILWSRLIHQQAYHWLLRKLVKHPYLSGCQPLRSKFERVYPYQLRVCVFWSIYIPDNTNGWKFPKFVQPIYWLEVDMEWVTDRKYSEF